MTMRRQKFLLFRVYQFRDTRAYGELYDLYFEKIHRYVYFKLPRGEDVDEVTADVFLRGWEYATSSRVEYASALFYRIARNLVADFYRKRALTVSIDEVAEGLLSEEKLVDKVAEKIEVEALTAQIRQLKDEYRDVIVMRYLDEMDVKEIAQALEKTSNNVRVLLHRAKKALKEVVDSSK